MGTCRFRLCRVILDRLDQIGDIVRGALIASVNMDGVVLDIQTEDFVNDPLFQDLHDYRREIARQVASIHDDYIGPRFPYEQHCVFRVRLSTRDHYARLSTEQAFDTLTKQWLARKD